MLRTAVPSAADPEAAWALIAEPRRWHEWAPHLRGAWGLGDPEVRDTARGAARFLGVLPIPAHVTEVTKSADRRHWVWKVGPVRIDHEVLTDPEGCTIVLTCRAPRPLETMIRFTYWPLVRRLVDNLATEAERTLDRQTVWS
ncbi:MAG: SRPBCC family protein [Solirubrobacteraceae bacterium]|nr:SRPBCC family protein [Patulibacter sp.]